MLSRVVYRKRRSTRVNSNYFGCRSVAVVSKSQTNLPEYKQKFLKSMSSYFDEYEHLAKKYPFEPSRKERSLGPFLQDKAKKQRQEFDQDEAVKNLTREEAQEVLHSKTEQLECLKRWLSNEHQAKYRTTYAPVPAVVKKHRIVLSTEAHHKIKNNKWGFWDKMKATIYDELPTKKKSGP
eukprot:TRINITY_DN162_c0_g1_i1.p1 TRINITY_DN162_c0_g1~~TRINITY_DN162_c0_g1_i1.p1  ORF type:complete len:180 (+),score=33.26 TRINITY_DN162_c0_g1_i1:36-575(+)